VERAALEAIPTDLQLPSQDKHRLEQAAGKVLDQSRDYQDLVHSQNLNPEILMMESAEDWY